MVDMYSKIWSDHRADQGLALPVNAQVGSSLCLTNQQLFKLFTIQRYHCFLRIFKYIDAM